MKAILSLVILVSLLFGCGQPVEDQTSIKHFSSNQDLKPMVIIHDGPGLSYSYMIDYLKPLSSKRELIFYDQITCYHRSCAKHPVEIKDLVKQLESITEKYGNNYTVLAHSWGTLLLLEYLIATPKNLHPDEIIFVTPPPLNWITATNNLKKLSSKYSDEEKKLLEEIVNPNQCLHALEIVTPYAVYDKDTAKKIKFNRYDCMIADYLMKKFTNYNYYPYLYLLPKRTLWVTGEKDYFSTNPIFKYKTINKSSHYPFIENNDEFLSAVNNFLDQNSNKTPSKPN
jgi:pimeloyl-ACP methyl ester carboxylesterase